MGIYLNPTNERYQMDIRSEIYVDKTELIKYTNRVMATAQRFVCVSRPRRFGKSMAANMLTAYYSRGCDSRKIFEKFKISEDKNYMEQLNRYDTIFLNMQEFLSRSKNLEEMMQLLVQSVLWDLTKEYKDVELFDKTNLVRTMQDIYEESGCPFVIIIDEWDCIFREYQKDRDAQRKYLDFLRDLLKDKSYVHLAYMTGILPVKKYGTHSALNMFDEFSMLEPGPLAQYVGFTEKEVQELCRQYRVSMEEMKNWYDGYSFKQEKSVYSPRSVVSSIRYGVFNSYWNQTETFEALRDYIDMNFEGLRDDVLRMMAGERISINTGNFSNDMTTFHSKDDVLTLLVHLGYLGYDFEEKQVFIPNHEIQGEYQNAVSASDWGQVSETLKKSSELLQAIWGMEAEVVAEGIAQAHFETVHIQYNDENALSYTISLALYAARNFYTVYREMPTGKGFADMVYIPRKNFSEKPAIVVELKWNKSAVGTINQIKEKQYERSLEDYRGRILLVEVNYDKKTRKHTCLIEKTEK